MTAIVKGVLENVWVNEQETKYGVKNKTIYVINGTRYDGGFKKPAAEKGDEVEIVYDETSKYHNVKSIQVLGKSTTTPSTPRNTGGGSGTGRTYRGNGEAGGFPLHPKSYERALDRRNALNAAVESIRLFTDSESLEITEEDVIALARKYEAYTTGDLDVKEAENAFDEQDQE